MILVVLKSLQELVWFHISKVIVFRILLMASCYESVLLKEPLKFDMLDLCGDEIELGFSSNPTGRLTYTGRSPSDTGTGSCIVIIKPGLKRDHIGFKFEDMRLSSGLCFAVGERQNEYGTTYPIIGTQRWYCDNSSIPTSMEYHSSQNNELVVTVTGTQHTVANISLLFTLYNEEEVALECANYTCENKTCVSIDTSQDCSHGYTPCDLHDCIPRGTKGHEDRRLTILEILGIVLGVVIGLGLCLCKLIIRSSYIKEDIINRLASNYKYDVNGSRPQDDPENNGMNKLVSITERQEHQKLCDRQESYNSDIMTSPVFELTSLQQACCPNKDSPTDKTIYEEEHSGVSQSGASETDQNHVQNNHNHQQESDSLQNAIVHPCITPVSLRNSPDVGFPKGVGVSRGLPIVQNGVLSVLGNAKNSESNTPSSISTSKDVKDTEHAKTPCKIGSRQNSPLMYL